MGDEDSGDGDGYRFGHRIYLSGDGPYVARYRDTDEPVPRGPSRRPCPLCGGLPTPEGHDPCIANLPGVCYACCGHGVEEGYVVFETGHVIRGCFEQAPRK
jgi:hypothetical protein